MKFVIAGIALSIGTIALAQQTPADTQSQATPAETQDSMTAPTPEPTPAPDQTAPDPAAQPSGQTVDDPSQATGPAGVTQQGTDPNGQAAAPAGVNAGSQPAGMVDQSAMTPRPATAEYPRCSRTVTDSCVQTYERGRKARS